MSQAGAINSNGGGSIPVTVPTSFITDDGTATTSNNEINVNGGENTINNLNGIETFGGVAGTGTQNKIIVALTNRFSGSATSTSSTPVTLMTCPMPTSSGVYQFVVNIVGHDTTNGLATSTVDTIAYRTTASAPVLLSGADYITQEDPAISASITYATSSTTLTIEVASPGGATINWSGHGTYIVVN